MAYMPAEDFFSKCAPLTRTGIDSCSGLTLCNLSPTSADELDNIYKDSSGRWRIMGALLDSDIMAKACQIEENPLYTYIRAYSRDWGTSRLGKVPTANSGLIEVMPFVKVSRKNLVNNNYWKWTKTGDAGTISGITYDVRGTAESLSSIPADVNWFPDKLVVHISGLSSGGSATKTQWLVVHQTVAGDKVTLYVRSQNAGSSFPGSKLQTPLSGVLMRGANNISPYESHCDQIPRLNTKSTFLAFVQHTRWSICNDKLTQEFKEHLIKNNPLYREYYHVEEAEYNKTILGDFQSRLVHQFLFGKPLPNQNETDWPELEPIESMTDTGDHLLLNGIEGRCIGRRAQVEGVYEQLNRCGRVYDMQGDVLNWPELQDALYDLYRVRKSSGTPNPELIEVIVDSAFRIQFIQGLIRYMKMRYEDTLRFTQAIGNQTKTSLGFNYQDFQLDFPAGVTLRVTSHISFDDYVSAHKRAGGEALARSSRWMLFLDWSNIYMANLASETVELSTGNIQDLAKINSDALCRMKVPTKSMKHYALLWTAVVECPASSLWLENFDFGVPEHQFKYGTYNDYRGNQASND